MPEPQREQFVREYIKDFNATKAALRAGYSKKTARTQGSRLLTDESIQEKVSKALEKRLNRVEIDAEYVLRELLECWNAKVSDLFNDEGSLLPIKEWPDIWQKMIGGLDIKKITAGYGDDEDALGTITKIATVNKMKVLEQIGQHIDVQAFKQVHEHTVTHEISDKLSAARKRMRQDLVSEN